MILYTKRIGAGFINVGPAHKRAAWAWALLPLTVFHFPEFRDALLRVKRRTMMHENVQQNQKKMLFRMWGPKFVVPARSKSLTTPVSSTLERITRNKDQGVFCTSIWTCFSLPRRHTVYNGSSLTNIVLPTVAVRRHLTLCNRNCHTLWSVICSARLSATYGRLQRTTQL